MTEKSGNCERTCANEPPKGAKRRLVSFAFSTSDGSKTCALPPEYGEVVDDHISYDLSEGRVCVLGRSEIDDWSDRVVLALKALSSIDLPDRDRCKALHLHWARGLYYGAGDSLDKMERNDCKILIENIDLKRRETLPKIRVVKPENSEHLRELLKDEKECDVLAVEIRDAYPGFKGLHDVLADEGKGIGQILLIFRNGLAIRDYVESYPDDCIEVFPYTVVKEWDEESKLLAESAREASREAVARAFAAGLPITVAKDGKLMRIAPDGTETIIRAL